MEHVSIKNIGVLTSSRADFGIYLPLIKELQQAPWVNLELIVFGTHLSANHGYTVDYILQQGVNVTHQIITTPEGDAPVDIAVAIGDTQVKFAHFWQHQAVHFDLVFCLGDRYEMFAAVMAGVPFGIKFAHLHGGETTLGAIDNVFRHAISHASWCHFTSTQLYADRLTQMLDDASRIFNSGSVSLDNLLNMSLLSVEAFEQQFGIHLAEPTLLATLHPETVSTTVNSELTHTFCDTIHHFTQQNYQCIITLPNADTYGNTMRAVLANRLGQNPNVFLKENLGVRGYFSAMKLCRIVVGNSSSGIIEAASFGKYVINIGSRQQGRLGSQNLVQIPATASAAELINTIEQTLALGSYEGTNIYFKPHATGTIVRQVAQLLYDHSI